MKGPKRVPGVTVSRGIVYGNVATNLGKKLEGEYTHRWTVYVRGRFGEDISYLIKSVTFKLHESFANPVRVIETAPFELTECGWGEFEILMEVELVDPEEPKLVLHHLLKLYPNEETVQISKKAIQAESLDEIVINEPTEFLYNIMLANPPPAIPVTPPVKDYIVLARQHLRKIGDARSSVQSELLQVRSQAEDLEREKKRLAQELARLQDLCVTNNIPLPK
eukprot:Colp12_sorted_trinity150504_noHs@29756